MYPPLGGAGTQKICAAADIEAEGVAREQAGRRRGEGEVQVDGFVRYQGRADSGIDGDFGAGAVFGLDRSRRGRIAPIDSW